VAASAIAAASKPRAGGAYASTRQAGLPQARAKNEEDELFVLVSKSIWSRAAAISEGRDFFYWPAGGLLAERTA
jgi:hypothetical protein